MAKYVVATVREIPPGGRKIVEVGGRTIGVFNVAGEFFALRNSCPHQGGPLCKGAVSGFLQATVPGQYTYLRQGEILRCPWHGWEFDIRTGQSWYDPVQTRVRRYKVTVESGNALSAEEQVLMPGLEKGPYVAETYPVSVEQQYVVVEIA
jgi:3-phenylpropionate/trans-cinnamate dioxygenase ferredoxin subunit